MIAQIIIDSNVKNLNKVFDYKIPLNLENKAKIGARVFVPFGNMKNLEQGFIIGIKQTSEYKVKEIASVNEEVFLGEKDIKLAKWMADRYFCNISDCIKLMLAPGTKTKIISNRIKEKMMNFVYLRIEENELYIELEKGKIKSDKQVRALRFLLENGETMISDLEIFADVSRAVIKTLEKNGYIGIEEKQVKRNPFIHKTNKQDKKFNLNNEQQNAYNQIKESIDDLLFSEFLLFGVTGSGKTEIYLQTIEKVVNEGKTSIMLVPEISLTPQTVDRFISRFGEEKIAVLHSKLSIGERFDEWNKIKEGKAKIVIGARSAIFAPVKNLGVIIIDEEHDSSYKSEMTPKYHAREVARYIARRENIPLILGSATPSMETYYNAYEKKDIILLELSKRANLASLPKIEIVDLREELANGNRSMISTKLYKNIQENLEKKHQTILFLNRRGYSTFVMCRNCGYTVKCKNCNISMTYHANSKKLKCHYCGYEKTLVTKCPECGSDNIKYFGTGTQKLEEQINKIFKQAKTIRMDVDTVTRKNSHEEILNKFKEEQIDILIGTQMVVKGHHFPNVTLVGVISADGSLNLEDFRACEKAFGLLTQVAGRAGREKNAGKVIIQTYQPEHYCIELAKKQDYKEFYQTEIILRKQLRYPPFCDIIVIGINGEKEQDVVKGAKKLHQELKIKMKEEKIPILLYSPVPAPVEKIKNRFRWRIIIKCKYENKIANYVNNSINQTYQEKDNIRVNVDINPSSMM